MPDEKSPIFQVESGERITDQAGGKAALLYFQLAWGTDPQPGGLAKALIYTVRYPGSRETLDVVLRVYDEAGQKVIERNDRDKGEVRRIADLFEKNAEAIENGTPIGVLNLDPARVATLKEKGVLTVEALRDVPESRIGDLGIGGRAMQERAISFLEEKDRFAEVASLRGENESLRETQKAQQEEFAKLQSEMAELRKMMTQAPPAPRGRGQATGAGG